MLLPSRNLLQSPLSLWALHNGYYQTFFFKLVLYSKMAYISYNLVTLYAHNRWPHVWRGILLVTLADSDPLPPKSADNLLPLFTLFFSYIFSFVKLERLDIWGIIYSVIFPSISMEFFSHLFLLSIWGVFLWGIFLFIYFCKSFSFPRISSIYWVLRL